MIKKSQLKAMWPEIQQKLQNPPSGYDLGGFKMPHVDKIIFDDQVLAEEPGAIAYVSTADTDNNGILDSLHIVVPRMEQALRERGITSAQDVEGEKLYSLLTAFVEVFSHEMAHMPVGGKIPETGDPLRPEGHAHSEGEAAARRVKYTPQPLAATNIQNKIEKLGSFRMKKITEVLMSLGNDLDSRGNEKLANEVDDILRKVSRQGPTPGVYDAHGDPFLYYVEKDGSIFYRSDDSSGDWIPMGTDTQKFLAEVSSGVMKPVGEFREGAKQKDIQKERFIETDEGLVAKRPYTLPETEAESEPEAESELETAPESKRRNRFRRGHRQLERQRKQMGFAASSQIIKTLKVMGDNLDNRGEIKLADQVDNILRKMAQSYQPSLSDVLPGSGTITAEPPEKLSRPPIDFSETMDIASRENELTPEGQNFWERQEDQVPQAAPTSYDAAFTDDLGMEPGLEHANVEAVQTQLLVMDYLDSADGFWGPKSEEAWAGFLSDVKKNVEPGESGPYLARLKSGDVNTVTSSMKYLAEKLGWDLMSGISGAEVGGMSPTEVAGLGEERTEEAASPWDEVETQTGDDLVTETAKRIEKSLIKEASNMEHVFSLPADGGPFGRN